MKNITEMSFFAHIAKQSLDDITCAARFLDFSKKQNLFCEGQAAQNFMVLLKGQVKLYKFNDNGDEAIIHIANPGEALLASALFNNAIIPLSAEALTDAQVMVLPARTLRQLLKTDNQLCQNMLAVLAEQASQHLYQFNQLKLSSVPQRVGNFLLQQYLSNKKATNRIDLPYDKAIIAKFLGMQPESFSRALSHLRQDGIITERDTITVPHLFALCDYCDLKTAQDCHLHGTPECANPQCG